MLPATAPSSNHGSPSLGYAGASSLPRQRGGLEKAKRLASRLLPHKWPAMDWEQAGWQLLHLTIAPRRVYRNVYYHKQTKNTWARDDPAILLLMGAFLGTAAILWTALYVRSWSPLIWAGIALRMIFRDFILSGLVLSTVLWSLANRFLTHSSHTHATDQRVEWQYAFDIHTNSFFPLFLNLYLAQLVLAPVVTRSNWVCLWVGNTLYLVAMIQYAYITYLGYNALPFLIRSELLLFPIGIWFALYVVSLLGFNVSSHVLESYFSPFVTL